MLLIDQKTGVDLSSASADEPLCVEKRKQIVSNFGLTCRVTLFTTKTSPLCSRSMRLSTKSKLSTRTVTRRWTWVSFKQTDSLAVLGGVIGDDIKNPYVLENLRNMG